MMAICSVISKVSISFTRLMHSNDFVEGNEYSAIVEYAPSQKLPLAPKQDTRQGTIEEGSLLQ